MSFFFLYTPFLVILVIAIVMFFSIRKTRKRSGHHSYVKRTQWILTGYVVVLVLAATVFYLLPKNDPLFAENGQTEDVNLYQQAKQGNIVKKGKGYRKSHWEFTPKTNQIYITANEHPELLIFAAEQKNGGKTIDVSYYETPVVIDGFNVSEHVKPMGIKFKSGQLSIIKPDEATVEFSLFKPSFINRQFSSEDLINHSFKPNQQILYLQIPETLQVETSPNVQIEHLNGLQ